jgi:hypothetical protein
MTSAIRPLTFNDVDELGFAAARGLLEPGHKLNCFSPRTLGPLLELMLLIESGLLPCLAGTMTNPNGADPFIRAMIERRERWLSPEDNRMGFIRSVCSGPDTDASFTGFLMNAKRAARDVAMLPGDRPGRLVAAMVELENNIHEHSDAADTGVMAFRAVRGRFEFVVADLGVGVLTSLRRCPDYSTLSDHGDALRLALKDGTSRFGTDSDRGYGFRPIFIGLMNLTGFLRFRSGDHALVMDGTSPNLATAQLAQKPSMKGFFASIMCTLPPPHNIGKIKFPVSR